MVVLHVNHVVDRTHLPLAVYYIDSLTLLPLLLHGEASVSWSEVPAFLLLMLLFLKLL